MRPDKLSVPYLFQKSEQYMIPLFQRGYVWTLRDQILPLWEDLIDRMDALTEFKNNSAKVGSKKLKTWRKHFLGTVVVGEAKGGGREAVPAREVIDGQQRITTALLHKSTSRRPDPNPGRTHATAPTGTVCGRPI